MFKKTMKKYGLVLLALSFPFLGYTSLNPLASLPSVKVAEAAQKDSMLNSLLIERLELSKDLALCTWNEKLAIDDITKEKIFMEEILSQSTSSGIDPSLAANFFHAQMEASKVIIIENFENWVKTDVHKHEYIPDLQALNAKIKEVDGKILQALKDQALEIQTNKSAMKSSIAKELQSKGYSRDVIDSATDF